MNTHLESVFSIGNQFFVTEAEHLEFGTMRRVHSSTDGVTWTEEEVRGADYLYGVDAGQSGAAALSEVAGSSALATTTDGRAWSNEIFVSQQDDGRDGWLQLVAAGRRGPAAIATLNPGATLEALSITVGSRTARFGPFEPAVRIIDDSTGQVLLDLDWLELDQPVKGEPPGYATYEDGATSFWSSDGTLVMTITDVEAYQAFDEQAARYEAGIDHTLLIQLNGEWYDAELPDLEGAIPQHLAVGDDLIIIGTTRYGGGAQDSATAIGLLLGILPPQPTE